MWAARIPTPHVSLEMIEARVQPVASEAFLPGYDLSSGLSQADDPMGFENCSILF